MNELFQLAESHETAAGVGVASGSSMFHKAVRELSVTGDLLAQGGNDQNERAIASRIADLVQEHIDLRYRHPHDIPLAIYLYVLYQLNREVSRIAAHAVLETPNCSWAGRVAHGILDDTEFSSDTTSIVVFLDTFSTSGLANTTEVVIRPFAIDALRSWCRGSWSLSYTHDRVVSSIETGPRSVRMRSGPDLATMSLVA